MHISALIVEDLPDLADVMTEALRRVSMDVVTASTGSLALEALGAGVSFDVVLLDRSLPDMDGLQVAAHMRAFGYTGVIFIVSGHHGREHEEACASAGADAVVAKPFRIPDLIGRITSAVTPHSLVAM